MVSGPAGMRCRDCTAHPSQVTGTVDTTDRLGWAISAALFLSITGTLVMQALGALAFAAGPVMGALVADVILLILGTSQKPPYLSLLALGSIAFGSALVLCNLLPSLPFSVMALPERLAEIVVGLSIGLALSTAYGRIRSQFPE